MFHIFVWPVKKLKDYAEDFIARRRHWKAKEIEDFMHKMRKEKIQKLKMKDFEMELRKEDNDA